ncbi:siderophore ABC transporter substrate-binding protein [Vibrio sonorensis]|uniref:siderophore ABC transporter substrate-binding protein n=1 Tax=Vibrio sonorensis TaxID=1004316 RepID=UPI0008D97420|nr:ABC transporter substrate-binding protein [Vibrio sonorensis]
MRKLILSLLSLSLISSAAYAKSITVEHASGTTIIEKTPERVVVIGAGALDMLDYFGVNPVAVNHDYQPHYLRKYTKEPYGSTGTLFEADYEAIFTQKPDLIFTGPRIAGKYDELSEIAPTVVLTPHAEGSYWESTQQQWRIVGKIFGVSDKVEATIARIDKDFKEIREFNKANPPKALTVMSSGGNVTAFATRSRFGGSIYQDFGFEQAVDQKLRSNNHGDLISFEFIQEVNPDYLFIIDSDKLREEAWDAKSNNQVKAFDNDLVKNTVAFKEDHILSLSLDAWYVPMGGVRATEKMIEEMKQVLNLN